MNELAIVYPTPTAQVEIYVETLGFEGAIDFLLKFGGACLDLSDRPRADSRLVRSIGLEKAIALGANRERMQRRVPLASPWLARCLRVKGDSVDEIARKLRRADTTVGRWLKNTHGARRNPNEVQDHDED